MTRVEVLEKWDYEADVIVVGAGTAGLPAAIAAKEAGAKVAVLELMSHCGGSLAMIEVGPSFAGTDLQKKQGVEDSPEQYYRDGLNIAKGTPELWRVFADHQLDTYKWCKEIGMKFDELFPPPTHTAIRAIWAKGRDMVRCLERAARERNVEIMFLHRATRLISDPETSKVLGLKVRVKNEVHNFKAKRAVILTTGGFGHNREMVQEYGPAFVNCLPLMAAGHLGDGLKMALAEGAATKDIGSAVRSSYPVDAEKKTGNLLFMLYAGGILVNVNGKRFGDEGMRTIFYGQISEVGMRQPGGVYWVVYDDKIRKETPSEQLGKVKEYKGDTIEEAAKTAGIDPKGLKETIDKYNSDIEGVGYDTEFDRRTLVGVKGTPITIDTPPFYAVKGISTTTSFKGGIKINTRSQILNQYDEVIPGLYAAGEVTGGLWGAGGAYLLGSMVSTSMTFGRIAGRNAAAESSW